MKRMAPQAKGLWALILAGGNGKRLLPLTEVLGGPGCPKQFCALVGTRSMYEHTLDRVILLVPPERTVTVITRPQETWAIPQGAAEPPRTLQVQPLNRETAAGVLLPLLWIAERDSGGTVTLLPADHFIREEARFMAHVARAVDAISRSPDIVVLLGIRPERPEPDYGWIVADRPPAGEVAPVRAFVEKPDPRRLAALFAEGALCNTLVTVARVGTLLTLFRRFLPDMVRRLASVADPLRPARSSGCLEQVYRSLPRVNFSQAILERAPDALRALAVDGVEWSDWGSVQRVEATLQRMGRIEILWTRLRRAGADPGSILSPSA